MSRTLIKAQDKVTLNAWEGFFNTWWGNGYLHMTVPGVHLKGNSFKYGSININNYKMNGSDVTLASNTPDSIVNQEWGIILKFKTTANVWGQGMATVTSSGYTISSK